MGGDEAEEEGCAVTIADAMVKVLRQWNRSTVGYGHCDTLDECGCLVGMSGIHPLDRHARVLNGLDRDHRFLKFLFRCVIANGKCERLVRAFKLRCVQNLDGCCEVTGGQCADYAPWDLDGNKRRPRLAFRVQWHVPENLPPGALAVIAGESDSRRRELIYEAYVRCPFPECLSAGVRNLTPSQAHILADYQGRLEEIVSAFDDERDGDA